MPITRSMYRGPDARPGAGAAGHRVRRRDERVGAVVEVEERGLGPLEQHVLAGLERARAPGRRCRRRTARAGARSSSRYRADDVVGRERQPVVDLGQDGVLLLQRPGRAWPGRSWGRAGPAPAARRAAPCRRRRARCPAWWCPACCARAAARSRCRARVVGQDQVGVAADLEAAAVDALGLEPVDLGEQHRGSTTTPLPITGVMWS